MTKKKGKRTRSRKGKVFRIFRILFILAMLGALFMGGCMTAVFLSEKVVREPVHADEIIVLGARVMPNGVLSTTLNYRIKTAYELYEQGYAERFILCGAQGADEPMTEADAMAEYLLKRGVPESAIFREGDSFNTIQNIQNAKAFMDEQGYKTAMVVTSDYHIARAVKVCRDNGIDATGIGAPGPDYLNNRLKARFRESLSWMFYLVFGGE